MKGRGCRSRSFFKKMHGDFMCVYTCKEVLKAKHWQKIIVENAKGTFHFHTQCETHLRIDVKKIILFFFFAKTVVHTNLVWVHPGKLYFQAP